MTEMFEPYETLEVFPPGTILFREGAEPAGVHYVRSGEVDLCFSSKSLLIAGPGQMLGVTSVMSSRPYDCTATARTTCITGFVEKARFFRLLDERPALWLTVLQIISANVSACWDCMRAIGRRTVASAK